MIPEQLFNLYHRLLQKAENGESCDFYLYLVLSTLYVAQDKIQVSSLMRDIEYIMNARGQPRWRPASLVDFSKVQEQDKL